MKDKLEERFNELQGQFDIEEPLMGHFDRFEAKLVKTGSNKNEQSKPIWTWLSIAASVALIIGYAIGNYSTKPGLELADVSPQMQETQSFFVTAIQSEIEQVDKMRNPDNEKIINDAFDQLQILEENYGQLTIELQKSNKDKRVIYAMISNFQQRIDVLKNLLQQINDLKQLKTTNNDEKII